MRVAMVRDVMRLRVARTVRVARWAVGLTWRRTSDARIMAWVN